MDCLFRVGRYNGSYIHREEDPPPRIGSERGGRVDDKWDESSSPPVGLCVESNFRSRFLGRFPRSAGNEPLDSGSGPRRDLRGHGRVALSFLENPGVRVSSPETSPFQPIFPMTTTTVESRRWRAQLLPSIMLPGLIVGLFLWRFRSYFQYRGTRGLIMRFFGCCALLFMRARVCMCTRGCIQGFSGK